ncbi:tRNA lysidine(34) synthetase TilS [Halomonas huangheensis]|uniref:tRNA(Ile)-lysidine synthase n=1 Tax=Halomonas huangheensis TaxID=1178482 RepID=W1N2R2_9GAMM|nr:tRNA lysidine(34) synthetase TilS [Halomonas huangheensis]ALM51358.1 tRNA(Ile)-lysidine synthase [Halomonas huangheensis]ERL49793.1 hypothetical protein BJB45_01350 [Halomonas huangheensis]
MTLALHIDRALAQTVPGRAVWVALSGGLDSSLLLALAVAACRRHPRPLYALHVDHGLQPAAADFEHHCRRLCSQLGVPLFVERVHVDAASGHGIEGAARKARYMAFQQTISAGDTLWLAQHRDDQAETFLLAALRGSGTGGLAAMPMARELSGIHLQRPLLKVSRAELEEVAQGMGLEWQEDPSNAEVVFDRNYLRHRVLPQLQERWPQATAALARSAQWMGEADSLLTELAAEELHRLGGLPAELPLERLMLLTPSRQRLLIRFCARQLGLPTPPAARLATLLDQLSARQDAQVRVSWSGAEARCWRGVLWLMSDEVQSFDTALEWDGSSMLETRWGRHPLALSLPGEEPVGKLALRPRQGGESLRLPQRGRRDLKRLLQELGVPTWRRQGIAVVWRGELAIAALDMIEGRWLVVAEGWQSRGPWWPSAGDL